MATIEQTQTYKAEILAWRQQMDEKLRSETGWLSLTGLYWLHEGRNTVGSDPASDIVLPESAPRSLGYIEFHDCSATLFVTTETEVLVEGDPAKSILLRDDHDPLGMTRVEIGSVRFHVILRGDQYGIRVRDRNNPARQTFGGRKWFPLDPRCRVTARFTAYPEPRTLGILNVAGIVEPMENLGCVEFTLDGHDIRLEAFSEREGELWLIFRDASPLTYPAGRFLYAPLNGDGTATLDFNKAYNPPCAFTPYATCPLPPKENILSIPIEAGERKMEHA